MTHGEMALAQLLPLPLQARSSNAAMTEQRGATSLLWPGATDSRVKAYAERVLNALDCGVVAIEVAQIDSSSAPQFGTNEDYELSVLERQIQLKAASTWGALHGITTLRQLMSNGSLPNEFSIVDSPRFAWRGLMLDVARHFIPLSQLYAVVDGLQLLKLNVLHLHLSDDQGFRFGSNAWPRLASNDHYTMQELQSLVAYAADRGVRIIPEIDMPGHVTHWLVAYPQWGCEEAQPSQRFGVHPACLDPTREEVYDALASLFAELAEVFPDRYVHVGGDEVNPKWWQRSERIQAFITEHNLQDERGLQNYFLQRVHNILVNLDKQVIGWDEVLHEQMPDCLVQNWRGATTRDRALAVPRSCIVSAPYYLDLHFPADIHYRFDPLASQQDWLRMEDELAADLRLEHIAPALAWTHQWRDGAIDFDHEPGAEVIGGEACLWSELVDGSTLPMRLWSRLPGIAERLWSPADCRDVDGFYLRLSKVLQYPELSSTQQQRQCLEQLGLTAQQIEAANWLEPTKWYSRLLGEELMQARLQGSEMPQARPYQVDTPLNRVVDFLLPESLAARDQVADARFALLRQTCEQALAEQWPVASDGAVDAIQANLTAVKLTEQGLQNAEVITETIALVREQYRPYGEYMPGLIPYLISHLQANR